MRKPQDRLGQRVLVYELRHAIDRCRKRPWSTVAQRHLHRLIDENPRSVRAGHVLYNIGAARRDYLGPVLASRDARAAPLSPGPSDPHSLEVR